MTSKVQAYFQKSSQNFDAIYSSRKSLYQKLVDLFFHQVIQRRFEATFAEMGGLHGKRVLDIGCGSGRYLVAAAQKGASQVTGIDFAGSMLELAQRHLKTQKLNGHVNLVQQDFLEFAEAESYDLTLAIGYFDYLANPLVHLQKMKRLCRDKIIVSFPKKWTLRTLPRWLRLRLAGCPVFFYDRKKIVALLGLAKLADFKIISLSRDYLVVVKLGEQYA